MRPGIHPEDRTVVVRDAATGSTWRARSTITTRATVEVDGGLLPLVVVDTSAAWHPVRTGDRRVLDTAGRVDRLGQRHGDRGRR